jgi:hypothetical protein
VNEVGISAPRDDWSTVVVVEVLLPPLATAQAITPPATAPARTGSHLLLNFMLISIVVSIPSSVRSHDKVSRAGLEVDKNCVAEVAET